MTEIDKIPEELRKDMTRMTLVEYLKGINIYAESYVYYDLYLNHNVIAVVSPRSVPELIRVLPTYILNAKVDAVVDGGLINLFVEA